MLTKAFSAHLHIFQLEEYKYLRFLRWWITHPFFYSTSQKKPLVSTSKTRRLTRLSILIFLFLSIIFYLINPLLLLLSFLLYLQPFILIFASNLLLLPYEIYNRQLVISRARNTLQTHPHLTTIGITGSYGKTTTKDFLFQILDTHKPTLKTPGSFNTIFGIKRVLDAELVNNLYYFLAEYGAYVRGEIKELTRMVPPQYAILTAIGPQHLERFKSLHNTTLAKFELIDAVDPSKALLNLDNDLIRTHLQKHPRYHTSKTYSLHDPQADYFVSTYSLTTKGMNFTLKTAEHSYKFATPLFGTSNLYNLTAAIAMALILKVPIKTIQTTVSALTPAPHRLQLTPLTHATLIDNAYSSNPAGFTQIIKDLSGLNGKKALITPGIIELSHKSTEIHHQLGALAAPVFDTIILVGDNPRTQSFINGINSATKKPHTIKTVTASKNPISIAHDLDSQHDFILIENDLPDQY